MSGRRRRDDGWDDGRLDAQDDRRDPWADDGIGEWGGREADPGDDAGAPAKSSGGAAGAYVRNAPPSGKAYAAPDFPSFQATSGQGGQRGASNGHASAGYDGYRDAGYGTGRDGYQGAGYGRDGSSGNGGAGVTPPVMTAPMAVGTVPPAGTAGLVTAQVAAETTPVMVAAPGTGAPMAGPAALAMPPNSPLSIMMTRKTTARLGRPGRTGGFRFTRCMTIKRGNSTGWRNALRKAFGRLSLTLLSTSST